MLIIWLQGIWLPLHGYDFTETPLWAGIYMLPLTVGMLISGPTSGYLSDRFGARPFATGGMLATALGFVLLTLLPINFSYVVFAAVLFWMGISMGLFASPNRAAVMNSLPRGDRGAGGGMNQTFQNSAQVLSVGVFFSLMIIGLASSLPHTLATGLHAHGVGAADARADLAYAAGVGAVRGVPRLQPDPAPGRRARARHAVGAQRGGRHGPNLLPAADLRTVPHRASRGVRIRDRGVPGCGGRVRAAGWQVRARRLI